MLFFGFCVRSNIDELNVLFKKMYEDNASSKLSDERFTMLSGDYENEQAVLKEKVKALQVEISTTSEKQVNVGKFLRLVKKYTEMGELTYEKEVCTFPRVDEKSR